MHGLKRHFGVAVALACGLAVVSGTAQAAPPSSPPGQEQKAEVAAAPAEQSHEAPGQAKKAEPTEPAAQQQQQAAPRPEPASASKGQEQKAAKASSSSSTKVKTQGINSTSAGVKPSNSTAKHTTCWTGGAMPSPTCRREPAVEPADSSKRYGNGTTAAQIAVGRGAPADTEIRGPGNSQPHKVCGKNGNWVDVHAVKSYVGVCAAEGTSVAPTTASVTPAKTNVTAPASQVTSRTTASGAAVGAAVGAGGVAGVQGELGSAESPVGGVAGAFGAFGVLGAAGTLPFTGFPLWAVALLGVAGIAVGLALRRRARPSHGLA